MVSYTMFYINGTLNVAKQVFILIEQCCRRRHLQIKTELNDSNLGDFKTSNEWLQHFKKRSGSRQTRIVGETGDAPITSIKAWMGWLPQIIQGYSSDDIWNMNESELFLKLY